MMRNPLADDLDHVLAQTSGLWEELRGARVFVTGGTGFFGCWLLETFLWANDHLDLKASVVVLTRDRSAFTRRIPHLACHPAVTLHDGDVRTFELTGGKLTHVIHAATYSSEMHDHHDRLLMFDTIVGGTRRTLELARRSGARRLLLTSSGAVYGRQPTDLTHLPEDYTGGPDSTDAGQTYAEAKRAAELLCAVYADAHLEPTIARCFTFVGPYLPLDVHFAVVSFIRDAFQGGPIRISGDGTPYRSNLYAADLAIWLWTILLRGTAMRPYNVGSEAAISIADLAHAVSQEFTPQSAVRTGTPALSGERAERYVPSTARARNDLGVAVTVDLEEALRRTVDWYRVRGPIDVAIERILRIGSRRIGPGEPCYVIAEVGINHNGNLAIAKQLVDAAIAAGADAVKFQKRTLSETYRQEILDQPRHGEQGLQYLVPLLIEFELPDEQFRQLFEYCSCRRVTALCTPWDRASVDFLETCDVAAYKIGSPDLTNFPLIEYVAGTGKPLLLSTGMSTEEEVRRTLPLLERCGAGSALFHCVSTYPAAPEEINLRFMERLREWSGRPVGYSGHDNGIAISLAAVAMGARLVERHLTLDHTMRGPDHKASLRPAQFAEQVRAIREVELSIGVPHRWITRGETLNRRVLGKSLVAATDIPTQTTIVRAMLTSKSPGLGLSPQFIDRLVGRRLSRPMARDEMFLQSDAEDAVAGHDRTAIDVGAPWGVVARFLDFVALEQAFLPLGMSLVEFHVSDRDLDLGAAAYDGGDKPFGFVMHAPEYCHDTLIDLCSADDAQRTLSIERIQKTIDLARDLAPMFAWDEALFPRGPKIVMHVGGMSPDPDGYDLEAATRRLLGALRQLDSGGVDLLLENLPPYPWYFGGRWFGHVICDLENTLLLCMESGLGLCFDTSHAALECARSGASLLEFARAVPPYLRHLHISDGAGTSGEGLQIGEGAVNFVALLPVLLESRPTLIPEIWMGHHENGLAFRTALARLTEIRWASLVLGRPSDRRTRPDLRALTVMDDATIFTALRVIDTNNMGIAFVLDSTRHVIGVVTDGDIRHAFVRGMNLHDDVGQAMTRAFVHGDAGMSVTDLRARLPGRTQVIPVLDSEGRLADFASLDTIGEKP